MQPSTVAHTRARMSCFDNRRFDQGELAKFTYGTLIKKIVLNALDDQGGVEECVMAATLEWSDASAARQEKQESCSKKIFHILWEVPDTVTNQYIDIDKSFFQCRTWVPCDSDLQIALELKVTRRINSMRFKIVDF